MTENTKRFRYVPSPCSILMYRCVTSRLARRIFRHWALSEAMSRAHYLHSARNSKDEIMFVQVI